MGRLSSFTVYMYRVSQKKGKRNVIIMAKRHNMCCDKRHSIMHSNILLSLYYHVYYDVSLTFFVAHPVCSEDYLGIFLANLCALV